MQMDIDVKVQGKSGTMCKVVLKSKGSEVLMKQDQKKII